MINELFKWFIQLIIQTYSDGYLVCVNECFINTY